LYVSFAKYRLFYRALLQKRPIFLDSARDTPKGAARQPLNGYIYVFKYTCSFVLAEGEAMTLHWNHPARILQTGVSGVLTCAYSERM